MRDRPLVTMRFARRRHGIATIVRGALVAACLFTATAAWPRDLAATPADYRAVVAALAPGDTLRLAPGDYLHGLSVEDLAGTAQAPIRITAASPGARPTLRARPGHATISIIDSAHVEISNLDLDGSGLDVDAVKAEGHARFAHDIRLEGLRIFGHSPDQQTVGISTKCPAWGWVIRNNEIAAIGTGIYLGDSDGSAPFVGGTIEGNLVTGTTGYALQVKHQAARPHVDGMPETPRRTVIRHNVFAKGRDSAAGGFARPTVLLGGFPVAGAGSRDEYLFYGNFVYGNPTESLFQGEGNLAIYNNVFVNRDGDALVIQPHHDRPRKVLIFNNTILASGVGMRLAGFAPGYPRRIAGNVIFGNPAVAGRIEAGNLERGIDTVSRYLRTPLADPGAGLDLTPRNPPGRSTARPDPSLPESDVDFDGAPRGPRSAGAYAFGGQKAPSALGLARKAAGSRPMQVK